jgi:adenosylmethionine-8-amino-7-oxononanoate aminotransferase
MTELLELDRLHVWHPYSPMPATGQPLPIVSADGVRLRLADSSELIDAMASWWCAVHGYRHPALDGAVRAQRSRWRSSTGGRRAPRSGGGC